MEFLHLWEIERYADEFVRSHRRDAAKFRIGPPSALMVGVAWAAARLERLAAAVEGWAAGRAAEAPTSLSRAPVR